MSKNSKVISSSFKSLFSFFLVFFYITLVESLNSKQKERAHHLLTYILSHLAEKKQTDRTFRIGLSGPPGAGKPGLEGYIRKSAVSVIPEKKIPPAIVGILKAFLHNGRSIQMPQVQIFPVISANK